MRQTHRIQAVALIDGVLVVRLQFVEDDDMEDGKEDEDSVRDQGDHVRDSRKVEGHYFRGQVLRWGAGQKSK